MVEHELSVGTLVLAGTAVVLLLVGFIIAFAFLYQRKMARKSTDLLSATIQSQEKERARLARELHDGLQQEMSAVKKNIERATLKMDDGEEKQLLQEVSEKTGEVIADSRRMSHDLLPPTLHKLGLAETLDELSNQLNDPVASFTLKGSYTRAGANVELALFRIAQELVMNVAKHAEATELNITMDCTGTGIQLTVADNGKGFAQANAAGLGFANMESRLNAIGGSYTVNSIPGEGTEVTVNA